MFEDSIKINLSRGNLPQAGIKLATNQTYAKDAAVGLYAMGIRLSGRR